MLAGITSDVPEVRRRILPGIAEALDDVPSSLFMMLSQVLERS
jgi:hypothetical protein